MATMLFGRKVAAVRFRGEDVGFLEPLSWDGVPTCLVKGGKRLTGGMIVMSVSIYSCLYPAA